MYMCVCQQINTVKSQIFGHFVKADKVAIYIIVDDIGEALFF